MAEPTRKSTPSFGKIVCGNVTRKEFVADEWREALRRFIGRDGHRHAAKENSWTKLPIAFPFNKVCNVSQVNIDVEDVLAGVLGSIIGRVILFVFAVWLGCTIGGISLIVGMIVQEGTWQLDGIYQWLWASPVLLFSQWGFLNFPFLMFAFIYFIRSENAGYRVWGIILGVESLMVMLGWCKYPMQTGWPIASAWLTWALILAMVETGVWLLYQHQENNRAREFGLLHSEIAQRRAEKEAKENILINREKQENR